MKWRHPEMARIVARKFANQPGIETHNGYLTKWPARVLGPYPSRADLDAWVAEWDALPPEEKDPKMKLQQEIQNATTIAALKQILVKMVG